MRRTLRPRSTAPVFSVRQGTEDDARAMGGVAYRTVDLARDRAEEECRRIVREPFALSSVVTRRCPGEPERLVGVMNGVLSRPWFSKRRLAPPTPCFHEPRPGRRVPSLPDGGGGRAGERGRGSGLAS